MREDGLEAGPRKRIKGALFPLLSRVVSLL
jgi:hypothetical protein